MDLLQNPFYVLKASSFDSRQRISALFEERVLTMDPQTCRQARAELINPRRRLAAEVAWLPGLGPKRAYNAIAILEKSFPSLRHLTKLPVLAKANLVAAGIARFAHNLPDLTDWILELAVIIESVGPKALRTIINTDRIVSGFREITDLSMIEKALRERRQYYRQVVEGALNRLTEAVRVRSVTQMVAQATANGTRHGPTLIEDMVDSYYELKVQTSLEGKAERLKALAQDIGETADNNASDRRLEAKIQSLTKALRDWDALAQPIQICAASRGLTHSGSMEIAGSVGYLAGFLFDKSRSDLFRQLNSALRDTFAEVAPIADMVARDAAKADEIERQARYRRGY